MTTKPLAERVAMLRASVLAAMATVHIPDEVSPETTAACQRDCRRVYNRWLYFRRRCAIEATEPGEAASVIAAVKLEPAFRNYNRVKHWARQRSEYGRTKKRAENLEYYERVLRARRSSPEVREALRLRKQAERASKKLKRARSFSS